MSNSAVKQKVLVADDERMIADPLAMILNRNGFEARAVHSGKKALELAQSFEPDMLISDVMMEDVNGIDVAIGILALLPKIKILLFSGPLPQPPFCSKRRELRATNSKYFAKPIHPQDLLNRVRARISDEPPAPESQNEAHARCE